MPKLNLITPPDKLFNESLSILLIYPSTDIKNAIQDVLKDYTDDINVFIYELDDKEQNIDWLLSVCSLAEYVVFDVDNSSPDVRRLASYIISKSNTYWLTNEPNPLYTILSVNQIYNLDFLNLKGTSIEQ